MRQLFAFPTIVISLLLTVLSSFFGLSLPAELKGLIDVSSLIYVMSPVLGRCLVAYGSEWGLPSNLVPTEKGLQLWLVFTN